MNVVGAQAIYCDWTKGKAGSLCIGLLLHLICSRQKTKTKKHQMVQRGLEVHPAVSCPYHMTVNTTNFYQPVT